MAGWLTERDRWVIPDWLRAQALKILARSFVRSFVVYCITYSSYHPTLSFHKLHTKSINTKCIQPLRVSLLLAAQLLFFLSLLAGGLLRPIVVASEKRSLLSDDAAAAAAVRSYVCMYMRIDPSACSRRYCTFIQSNVLISQRRSLSLRDILGG